MQNTGKKMKSNDYFSIFRKQSTKFYKNPTFKTFCDDVINVGIIYIISKHVFIIKE